MQTFLCALRSFIFLLFMILTVIPWQLPVL